MNTIQHKNIVKVDRYAHLFDNVHSGSWFGLPDLGITEAVGGLFGSPRTAQGGSNIIGGQQAAAPTNNSAPTAPTTQVRVPTGVGPSPTSNFSTSPTANTSANTTPQNTGPSAEQQMQDKIRSGISSGFDQYLSGLDQQLQLLPEHYQALQDNISSLYGGQKSTIDTARANENANLDENKNQVDSNMAKSLRDLGGNFKDALDAANNKLGVYGASDSSAAPMYSYALGLQANKNQGNLQQQANDLYNTINTKRTQLGATMDDHVNQLDTWKNTELSNLSQWLTDQKSKIISAKGGAELEKSKALAGLDQSALGRLQQLDDMFTQYKEGLQNWALNHKTALDTALAYAHQGAQVQVSPFEQQLFDTTLQNANNGGGSPTDLFGFNPYSTGKKYDQNGNPIG